MTGVARNLLISNHVVRTTYPIFRKSTQVTMDLLVLINGRYEV